MWKNPLWFSSKHAVKSTWEQAQGSIRRIFSSVDNIKFCGQLSYQYDNGNYKSDIPKTGLPFLIG